MAPARFHPQVVALLVALHGTIFCNAVVTRDGGLSYVTPDYNVQNSGRGPSNQPGDSVICRELVLSRGYPCEDHSVTTKEGFVLALQRIPGGKQAGSEGWEEPPQQRPPVLLMHGILQGGDSWLLNFPAENTLALTLADAGFNVFLGNFRGARWSNHTTLPRSDKRYWDWSWEDLAKDDLPALLRYVHDLAQAKVLYVGHSQGTLTLLAALAEDSGVAPLLSRAVLLCPIAYLGHITSAFLRVFSRIYLDTAVRDSGLYEFNINSALVERMAGQACAHEGVRCNSILASVTGPNCCISMDRLAFFFQYEFQSTSVKNLAHLAQMIRTGRFAKYDYGWVGNLRRYFRLSPPAYDLRRIPSSLPMLIAYGGMDALSDPLDVHRLRADLVNAPQTLYVPHYAHGDFILGKTAKEEVYDKVSRFLWRTPI
ncbi:Triacylglycerol lipase [Klebsormidium nitens]|uniref:Lipase n=1 Tax=Klebsormidium nitens TaxID=105231 RepID=A0A1Y1I9M1_KLENI|nr:Triacylglycerol lipase [Klebsormidium nitens]|eukprot:GAQ87253.1 Triacylglycerol lipase [Klebsormidium nitens]